MAAYQLEEFIQTFESWGLTDVLLPFILIFTIVFAVMQKANILGEGKKNFNVVIALVVALSVVIPHVLGTYPAGRDVVDIINEVLPQISLIAVAFLTVLILAGMMGAKLIGGEGIAGLFVLLAIIGVLGIFGGALGWWESGWLYNIFGEETIAIVIMLLVFGLIIWFITSERGGAEKVGDNIKKALNFMMGK